MIEGCRTFTDVVRRPGVTIDDLRHIWTELNEYVDWTLEHIVNEIRYQPYIERARRQSERLSTEMRLPADFDYKSLAGLSAELREKLSIVRPTTIDQASRISGMTPAAVVLLSGIVKKSELGHTA